MIPVFAIEGGVGLAAGRAASVVGLIGAFGGLLYVAWLVPGGVSARTRRRLGWVAWSGLATALAGGGLWLVLETGDLAGAVSAGNLGAVLGETQFGRLLLWRVGLLGLAAGAFALGRLRVATVLAGAALALQAGHGHAEAMYGPGLLLLSSGLHLLASGAWLGALLPLLVTCVGEPPAVARLAARRFHPVGVACVSVLVVTAGAQSVAWIGSVQGLFGTAYGWMALAKLGLFAALVALAAGNRRRHAAAAFDDAARWGLVSRIVGEVVAGLAVVFAAGVLMELAPAMRM